MKRISLFIFLIVCGFTSALYAQVPGLTWTKNVGGPDDAIVKGNAVAIDAGGNVYTTGNFTGTVDFDPGTGVFELTATTQDGFVSKVDANGNFVWAIQFGSNESDDGNSITIDAAGNVLMTGSFSGTVDFDPGAGVAELTSFGSIDIIVLKLTAAGNFVFAKQLGGIDYDFGNAITTDASNNSYITGGYSDEADFNPDESTTFYLTANDLYDAFIVKLDVNGNFQWANSYGNDGEDYDTGESLTIDPTGNIYLAGQFGHGDAYYNTLFIKKLAVNGALIWEEEIGDDAGVSVNSLQSDASGNIYFSGFYEETTDFNPLGTPVELMDFDSYICKINSSGIVIWAKSLGFGYDHSISSMDVDVNGNIFLTGSYAGFVDMDPGAGVAMLYTPGDDYGAMFISKLNNNGDYIWAQGINGGNFDNTDDSYINSTAITTDNAANIYVTGDFYGTVNLATGVCLPNELDANSNDQFVMKLSPTSIPSTCFGVIEQPQSSVACQGSSVTLTALAAGAPRVTYQWQKFNGSVFVDISDQEGDEEGGDEGYEGTNLPFLTVTTIDDSGTGQFRCKVSGESVADAFSEIAILTYSGSSNIPYVVANSGCGPGQFLITAYGGVNGTYRWYDSNQNLIDGQVNSTFTTPLISTPTNFYVSKGTAECQSDPVVVQVNTNACAPVPGLVWVAQPDPASNSYISFKNMIIDATGNTYTTGTFTGTVDFDSGPGVVTLSTTDPEEQENFVLKLNKDRDVVWVKSLSDTNYGIGIKISVDGSGGLYLAGGFRETVDFDPGAGSFPMTATSGNLDMFITKLNIDGNFIWAKQMKTTFSNNSAFVQGITSDANGVYTTGSFTGSVDFDPNAGIVQLNSAGSVFFSDIFISKLDPSGNYSWAYRFGRTSATDGGTDIKVDGSGNVFSTGRFSGTVDFDPSASVFNLVGGGATDYYVQKLSNAGVFQWAIASGGATGSELPTALAVDASGNPHLTGTFGSIFDADPGAGVTQLNSGNGLVFVLKLNGTNGSFVWAKNIGGTFASASSDITIDASGSVLIVGGAEGNANQHPDFDPGPGEFILNSNVNRDAFLTVLDANGNFSWAYNLASTGYQYSNSEMLSVVTNTDGSIYTSGTISYSSDMDPGHCTYPLFVDGGGSFIQKIKPGIKTLCFNLQPITASVCDGVPATFTTAATGTTNITYRWQKLNTTTSVYENLTNTTNYSGVTTSTLSINTNGNFGAGSYRCYVTGDLAPDKTSDVAVLTVSPNSPPLTTGATSCSAGSLVLTASGGTDGQYRWYNAPTGGIALSETSHQFTTPSISITTTYYVSIVNVCESTRTPVVATITGITPTVTSTSVCTETTATLKAAGGSNGQYRWYDVETGGTALSETSDTFSITSLTTDVTYYVSINNGNCESNRIPVTAAVATPLAAPTTTGSSHCGAGTVTLTASGGTDGQYRWYTLATGGTPMTGEVNGTFVTPAINVNTNYYVSLNNGCESDRTMLTAEIKSTITAPSVTGQNVCGTSNVTLSASGGTNGQYRWYTAATGGTSISGEVNSTLTITSLAVTTSYYVSILNGCESERVMVTANVFNPPDKPTVTSSITTTGNTIALCKDPVTLTGPSGFASYNWSNGATTQSIVITSPQSNISLIVKDANGCTSPASNTIDIIVLASCINSAPNINTTNLTTPLEGSVTINLLSLISDEDDNLDPNSLRIVTQPTSGAFASIDGTGILMVDYKGVSFSGKDRVGIEACDLSAVCSQEEITIDVVGDVVVYNGISPNGDGKNDFFILQYIDVLEETKNNKVYIFNRWGDVVFEVSNYNNTSNYFTGLNKNGNELPSGNYFYKVDYQSGKKSLTGYLTLKR